ncbi:hypothetical protein AtNW77_Chr5g0086961 [Arabidopsis thaliana]|uniref:Transmembrane protein n=4 Tax=Arabidopsis TaxID=3701 RepID=Q9LZA7_ARATH|nr:uncharacterized protein AT5G04030 [Arabidopsis thaliana]KAG7601096.1 hypothetical protein ISN45_At05g003120 [Arabidopsis thaliana x Arabidopsis arenosa]KAG7608041.1 hypothetical protein ISN44_As05g003180 [Arabidopsis suecica]AED90686.1 transmembrane protein [Arabidopsis thaliana]OAO91010.1 hypothetical protein AXX17_AT5G03390 [Arabidopsis thaliana]CAA0400527.1 unnamed protein product [Arabidopsis thaliana]|eukprot:NP_196023.1 transmembrane protein [Arabidopsis thaliana]
MALRMNHVRFLLILIVVAFVAGESFTVKQDSAKGDVIWEEVFHGDYGSWSPTPKIPRRSPAPIPHDDFAPPRRLKA